MVHAKSYKILCLWFLSFRSRHKEKWTDLLVLRLAALGRQEFYATSNIQVTYNFVLMVSCRDAHSSDSPKNEGIKGNRALRKEKIRRNRATIALAEFFAHVIAGSIGFQRVAVLEIGSVRKGAQFAVLGFFQMFSPLRCGFLFSKVPEAHTEKWTDFKIHRRILNIKKIFYIKPVKQIK